MKEVGERASSLERRTQAIGCENKVGKCKTKMSKSHSPDVPDLPSIGRLVISLHEPICIFRKRVPCVEGLGNGSPIASNTHKVDHNFNYPRWHRADMEEGKEESPARALTFVGQKFRAGSHPACQQSDDLHATRP